MSLMLSVLEKKLSDLKGYAKVHFKCERLNASKVSKRVCIKRQYFAQQWTREGIQKVRSPLLYSECKDCKKGRKIADKLGLGEFLNTKKKKRTKCSRKSCNQEVFGGGMCREHYLNYFAREND